MHQTKQKESISLICDFIAAANNDNKNETKNKCRMPHMIMSWVIATVRYQINNSDETQPMFISSLFSIRW